MGGEAAARAPAPRPSPRWNAVPGKSAGCPWRGEEVTEGRPGGEEGGGEHEGEAGGGATCPFVCSRGWGGVPGALLHLCALRGQCALSRPRVALAAWYGVVSSRTFATLSGRTVLQPSGSRPLPSTRPPTSGLGIDLAREAVPWIQPSPGPSRLPGQASRAGGREGLVRPVAVPETQVGEERDFRLQWAVAKLVQLFGPLFINRLDVIFFSYAYFPLILISSPTCFLPCIMCIFVSHLTLSLEGSRYK